MPRSFAITAAASSVVLDADRRGEVHFTVTNQRDRSVEGRAHLEAEHDGTESWIAVRGPAQRTFAPAGTERYTVDIDVPSDAPGGSHNFRLDMVGVKRPDEDYTQGQAVAVEVPDATVARAPGGAWRGIVTAAVVLMLFVGGMAWWMSGSGNGKAEEARPVPVRPEDPSEERATEMTSTTLTDRPPIPLPGREGRFIFGNYSNRDMDPNCTVTSVSARLLGAQGTVEVYEDAVGTNNLHVGVEYEVDREKARVEVAWEVEHPSDVECTVH